MESNSRRSVPNEDVRGYKVHTLKTMDDSLTINCSHDSPKEISNAFFLVKIILIPLMKLINIHI